MLRFEAAGGNKQFTPGRRQEKAGNLRAVCGGRLSVREIAFQAEDAHRTFHPLDRGADLLDVGDDEAVRR
tara:strand:- start:5792 stop:6001 length:210 start_codon:yes stop_codon:yes gene_type:complete